jgi:LmbE family N-acetylglucosaminyl deacetylase
MEKEMVDFVHDLLPLPRIEESRNVLCVLPHPDDGELGAGGTIARLKELGANVRYVLVTGGGAGIRGKSADETRGIRRGEQEEAAEILGVDEIRWLGYPDGGGYDLEDVRRDLVEILEEVGPDLVMTVDPFLPYEVHPDHVKCGMAVGRALLFDVHAPVAFFFTAYPNRFVCVDDGHWRRKFEAILAHRSQFDAEMADLLRRYFEKKAGIYGRKVGCSHAEGFKVLLPLMLHAFEESSWV